VLVWWLLWQHARAMDSSSLLTRTLSVVRFAGPVCVVVGMGLLDYHWLSDFIAGACIAVILLGAITHPALGGLSARLDERAWPRTSA
jgi:hypothetical protein